MMKKWLCAGLTALIAATAVVPLAACNSGDGRIKVKIGMWPAAGQDEDIAMFQEWKAAFEADYPQYDIIADSYTYDSETVNAKAPAGLLPTVFQTYFTEPPMLIKQGYIRDITAQLEELGWLDKMDPVMREYVTQYNKVYGVPRDGYGMGMLLNLDMLYQVGVINAKENASGEVVEYYLHKGDFNEEGEYVFELDASGNKIPLYPTTFDEVREVSELVVEGYSAGTYGTAILSTSRNGGWQFANIAWNFGSGDLQRQNADGSWTSYLNDDGAVAAMDWIKGMVADGLAPQDATLNYTKLHEMFGQGRLAMAFYGSDSLMLPVTTYGFDRNNLAFVPMPSVSDDADAPRYSLYGGTPFVFASNATDEQVMGALLFLKYMGRSPETDEISVAALERGQSTAQAKNMPIIPTIKPWTDASFLEIANRIENQHINVNTYYFDDFFNSIDKLKKREEPNICQEMYSQLDSALQAIISNTSTDSKTRLNEANTNFQNSLNRM